MNNAVKSTLIRKATGCRIYDGEIKLIKNWLTDTIIQPGTDDTEILEKIQKLFPVEYGEYLDSDKQKNGF